MYELKLMKYTWVYEDQNDNVRLSLKATKCIVNTDTPYQHLEIWETLQYGRVLFLDGAVQTTEKDEFVYHEMIAHPPLITHPNPRKVLIIGGGDGGAAREVAKHPSVESVLVVDIDPDVPRYSREYLPSIGCGYDNPKVELRTEDGIKYVQTTDERFDVILVDATDPVGPGVALYTEEFYKGLKRCLNPGGIVTSQSGNPGMFSEQIKLIRKLDKGLFKNVVSYICNIPTYPEGSWTFTMASDSSLEVPDNIESRVAALGELMYYSPEIHISSRVLPAHLAHEIIS